MRPMLVTNPQHPRVVLYVPHALLAIRGSLLNRTKSSSILILFPMFTFIHTHLTSGLLVDVPAELLDQRLQDEVYHIPSGIQPL